MENIAPEKFELIVRHLQGLASQPEEEQLLRWRQSDPQNQASFEEISRVWNSVPESVAPFQPDVSSAWKKVRKKTTEKVESVKNGGKVVAFPSFFWRVAASVLLLIGIGLVWQFLNQKQETWTKIASGNEKKQVFLPDSSVVWLNRNSVVQFTDFSGATRQVKISGEGFFQVTKNPAQPFQVSGKQSLTEVLGTSFRLQSPETGPDVVEVETGLVAFSGLFGSGEKLHLKPGKKAEIQSDGSPMESLISDRNFNALHSEKLIFENTSMPEVCRILESYFGVSITVSDAALSGCRFTGSFQKPEMGEVFQVVGLSANLRFEKTKDGYVLRGEGCQ